MYTEGQIVNQFGSEYLVERVWQVTDEEMERFDFYYRTRVRLVKINGKNGMGIMEFAAPGQEPERREK